jgi:hypothetical protein
MLSMGTLHSIVRMQSAAEPGHGSANMLTVCDGMQFSPTGRPTSLPAVFQAITAQLPAGVPVLQPAWTRVTQASAWPCTMQWWPVWLALLGLCL